MLLHDVTTYPGTLISATVVGVLEILDVEGARKTPNPRLFAVPADANREHELDDVRNLSKRLRKELERFFKQTAALESKEVELLDWAGPKRAHEILDQSAARFRAQQ